MNVMVTGVAGFLGSWVAEGLLKMGHSVVGVDNMVGGDSANIFPTTSQFNTAFYTMDVLDGKKLNRIMKLERIEVVYHCAALAYEGLSVFSPSLISQNIVQGTVNVAVAAASSGTVWRVVNCSSMARYGDLPSPPFCEMDEPRPCDPYGVSKLAAEKLLDLVGRQHGFGTVHLVPHNIYGPRQKYDDPYRNVASIFVNRMLQGKQPIIYGDGEQVRCFSYIDDVLPVFLEMATSVHDHGDVINVGPDEGWITVNLLAQVVADAVGFRLDPTYVPDRPGEVKRAWCSSRKVRRMYGLTFDTTIEEGIGKLVEDVRRRGPKPFQYHLPLEIDSPKLPRTWKERLM